jgi:hypothetical protein
MITKYKIFLEKFREENSESIIEPPYGDIKVVDIDGIPVYILFGDIDYKANKEHILTYKGGNNTSNMSINRDSYSNFLDELAKRFNSIPELKNSDYIVSLQSSASINNNITVSVDKPFITNGFKKNDPDFKMREIDLDKRNDINQVFYKDFEYDTNDKVVVIDDFITTGTSFKNAFDTMSGIKYGVTLFRLK